MAELQPNMLNEWLDNNFRNEQGAHYLEEFRKSDPGHFAVIKASGHFIEHELESLIAHLAGLQQKKLNPVVVYGWGKLVDKELQSRGIPVEKSAEGDRITSPETMQVIQNVVADGIVPAISAAAARYGLRYGHCAEHPLFHAVQKDPSLGLVGKITGVESFIRDPSPEGRISFIAPFGKDDHGTVFNINGDDAAAYLVSALKPMKYISLTQSGGILDQNGNLIKKVTIRDDYDHLVDEKIVTGGMLKKLTEAKKLLETMGKGSSVHLCTLDDLYTELFTYYGAGTKIVLGYQSHLVRNVEDLDQVQLKKLIEENFGKTLVPGYFTEESIAGVVLEEDYDGAAVLQQHNGYMYMDKIVVSKKTRNGGLGSELFEDVMSHLGEFSASGIFWRADPSNGKNKWYIKLIDDHNDSGFQKAGEWNIYWIGVKPTDLPEIINYATEKRRTLVESDSL